MVENDTNAQAGPLVRRPRPRRRTQRKGCWDAVAPKLMTWRDQSREKMGDYAYVENSLPQSKFEWRPEDVTIDSPEETANDIAEYEEWLAKSSDENSSAQSASVTESSGPNLDRFDCPPESMKIVGNVDDSDEVENPGGE